LKPEVEHVVGGARDPEAEPEGVVGQVASSSHAEQVESYFFKS
jgi:hypothetical protein